MTNKTKRQYKQEVHRKCSTSLPEALDCPSLLSLSKIQEEGRTLSYEDIHYDTLALMNVTLALYMYYKVIFTHRQNLLMDVQKEITYLPKINHQYAGIYPSFLLRGFICVVTTLVSGLVVGVCLMLLFSI